MAAATRLTEPLRTSSTANMPGPADLQEQWCQVLVLQPGGRDVAAGQEEAVPVLG
jgi:hypothetical protein